MAITSKPEEKRPLCQCGHTPPAKAKFCDQCSTPVDIGEDVFCLSVLDEDGNVAQTIPLASDEVSIGSAPDNNVIVAQDRYASRRHARLAKVNGAYSVEDLGSSNGTYLRLRRQVALVPNDELRIGTTVLRLEKAGPDSAQGRTLRK